MQDLLDRHALEFAKIGKGKDLATHKSLIGTKLSYTFPAADKRIAIIENWSNAEPNLSAEVRTEIVLHSTYRAEIRRWRENPGCHRLPTLESWFSVSMRKHTQDHLATSRRRPDSGLLHHSDQGVQYACDAYRRMLEENGIECSMSRTGNCYDNAVMESFWNTLKTELAYHEDYKTREKARHSIFEYMEVFYNRIRMHSSIGYDSPESFEAALN